MSGVHFEAECGTPDDEVRDALRDGLIVYGKSLSSIHPDEA